jgi:transmembrane sensor
MKQIHPPFDDSLLLRYLLGHTGEKENRLIRSWLGKDQKHRSYLDSLEKVWLEAGKITPPPVAVDVQAAWERVSRRIGGEVSGGPLAGPQTRIIRMPVMRYLAGAAAVLLLAFGIWLAVRLVMAPGRSVELVSAGQVIRDTLPDGTVISLNRTSRLIIPGKFRQGLREVKLNGEAYFEVKHDAHSPFVVDAGRAMIRVLGTSFNVKAYPGGDLEVTVVSGTVMLFTVNPKSGDSSILVLTAGQSGEVPVSSDRPRLMEQPSPDDLYWYTHTIEFRQTPLSEVFKLLGTYYSIRIGADDPRILQCRLTATFTREPVERVLEVISESFNLTVKKEGAAYIFYGNGCY